MSLFIILGDSSSSSDESHLQASTSRNSVSNFTVSTHSAFQPNVSKSVAQRANAQNQEIASSSRLNETDRNIPSDNLNGESNEDNIQNRTSRVRDGQETTRSQDFNTRQRYILLLLFISNFFILFH